MSNDRYVNLFDLAAATLASTFSASIPIRNIANQGNETTINKSEGDAGVANKSSVPGHLEKLEDSDLTKRRHNFSSSFSSFGSIDEELNSAIASGPKEPLITISDDSTLLNGHSFLRSGSSMLDDMMSIDSHRDSKASLDVDNSIASRIKVDGTIITDADGAAQQVIVDAIRKISSEVSIVGEESFEEERCTTRNNIIMNNIDHYNNNLSISYDEIYSSVRDEIQRRLRDFDHYLNAVSKGETQDDLGTAIRDFIKMYSINGADDVSHMPCSRVSVFIDPLDGTKSYAKGKYEAVSILVCIILDNTPIFGVICKPFGKHGQPSLRNTGCFACYGGILLKGAYVAGGDLTMSCQQQRAALLTRKSSSTKRSYDDITPGNKSDHNGVDPTTKSTALPRAVISKSRAGGVVGKCIDALSEKGLLGKELVLVDGAGEKSLRLLVGCENETLWFFPKPGTSLWDVGAADAILLAIGGKLTDKNGKSLDYFNKSRENASNDNGIVACSNSILHDECIRLYSQNIDKWEGDD